MPRIGTGLSLRPIPPHAGTAVPAWTDRRVLDLLAIEHPLLLAPMAGSGGSALAVAVAQAGGLGAIPCASIPADKVREEVATFRSAFRGPVNLNFFAHTSTVCHRIWPSSASTLPRYRPPADAHPSTRPCARWWRN
jgi:NAD(P)H-dependent flavin oxidoreductase YrpB (nitropropane dioxygenase family)